MPKYALRKDEKPLGEILNEMNLDIEKIKEDNPGIDIEHIDPYEMVPSHIISLETLEDGKYYLHENQVYCKKGRNLEIYDIVESCGEKRK